VAVYERTYRPYAGPTTAERTRFLVIPRYGLRSVLASRLITLFFAASFLPSLVGMILIYLAHNATLLATIGIDVSGIELIGPAFFARILTIQGLGLGFVLMMIVGPGLISADVGHNALPLYFARPFSRFEYVAGKITVLAVLLSAVTWIPGLLMWGLKAVLAGPTWTFQNLRSALAIFVGSWVWIVVIGLVTLAISASARRKLTAMAYLFAVFVLMPVLGTMLIEGLGLRIGWMLHLMAMVRRTWEALFGIEPSVDASLSVAWITLIVACAVSIAVLARKVRAYEIFR